ncbi:hypothetical protein [Chitinimonas naiadis]
MSNTINSLLAGLTVTTPSQTSTVRNQRTDFATQLGGAISSQTTRLTAVSTSMGGSGQELAMALRPALRAAGITVPPALRFELKDGDVALPGDPREAAVRAMLAGNPSLQSQVVGVVGQAKTQREAALGAAANDFLKNAKNPRRAQAVLDRYQQLNPTPAISATFDGVTVGVQEKSGNDWRPIKTQKEFAWDLAVAYQEYAVDEQALFDSLMAAVSSKKDGSKSSQTSETKDDKSDSRDTLKPVDAGTGAAPGSTPGLFG